MADESFNVETFAAYASADLTKRIREDLKKAFPNLKFSVRKSSGSLGVDVVLMKGDIDFSDIHEDIPYHKRSWERWNDPKPTWKGDIQLNQYHLDSYNPKYKELFEKILRIIRGEDWYDDSDAMTDYFNTAYYIHCGIGKWNKPYVYDPTLKKGTKPTLEGLGGTGMGDAYSQFDLDAETFNAPLVNEMYSPKGWSLWGRELRYRGKQQGKIIGNNPRLHRRNDPMQTYTGKEYVRWGDWAMNNKNKLVFDEVSQELKPNGFGEWMDVINETNKRLNPTSFVRGAETLNDWMMLPNSCGNNDCLDGHCPQCGSCRDWADDKDGEGDVMYYCGSCGHSFYAETFEAVAVAPKGVEAKKTIEKVMLNEYLQNTAARESIREALTNEIALKSGGYRGIRSKMQKNKQPKMLTESYDERLREDYEG
jgi:uncharacterized Zn finger protein (UPF0148 family)